MPSKKILIVDDSIKVAHELKSILETEGHEVIVAGNGMEGFEAIKNQNDIRLCISDLNMPELDGLAMIEKIKEHNPDCDIPFVMLTTEFDASLKLKGKSLNVSAWMIKPVKEDRLTALVDKLTQP